MIVNHDTKEAQFKIVYCGTPFGGKTTNLNYIYGQLGPGLRGGLVSIATNQDRTLFFDFLPVNATEIGGYQTRFQLYTVPSQRVYANTREVVLTGVDGIVFVADSDPERQSENREAYSAMLSALAHHGLDQESVPITIQFNKRDLDDAIAPEDMDESLAVTCASFLACATTGYQVFATLDHVTQAVLKKFHESQTSIEGRDASAARPAPMSAVPRDVEPLSPDADQVVLTS
ncbi:ADP-ribosylation factor-like protein [Verrucomicrobiales bacterium]|nr:ADP-ribosylation factor-like protein [Verrucomicrobiales bacterium]